MTSRPATGAPPGGPPVPAGPQPEDSERAEPQQADAQQADAQLAQSRPADAQQAEAQQAQPQPGAAAPAPANTPTAPPLAGDDPVERHRLSARVVSYWRWRAVFSAVPFLLLLISMAIVLAWGPWWIRWAIVVGYVVAVVIAMVVLPPIRYRVFWYAISSTEIDIQHGIVFVKRTVVPVHRVQNLRTERGPLADHYWMTNLKIKTAAGSVNLSGLDRAEADELCDRISRLADVADDV